MNRSGQNSLESKCEHKIYTVLILVSGEGVCEEATLTHRVHLHFYSNDHFQRVNTPIVYYYKATSIMYRVFQKKGRCINWI